MTRRPSSFAKWIGLWLGSVGLIAGLKLSQAIDPKTAFILFAGSMLLFIPTFRSLRRAGPTASIASRAALRYTKGIMVTSAAYALGLGAAITIDRNAEVTQGGKVLLALLPVLPIFAMIYVMGRYLVEETDEYLRHRATMASMIGLGVVLGAGSFWGFLESFGVVPHAEGWWVVPVWAIGMGLAQLGFTLRDRGEGE